MKINIERPFFLYLGTFFANTQNVNLIYASLQNELFFRDSKKVVSFYVSLLCLSINSNN